MAVVEIAALKSYARKVAGVELSEISESPCAAIVDGVGFYLASDDSRSLGKALYWADTKKLDSLNVFADPQAAGDLARKLTYFLAASSTCKIWAATPEEVVLAEATDVDSKPKADSSHLEFAESYCPDDCIVVDNNGVASIQLAGLEIARVEEVETNMELKTGVGQADREMQELVYSSRDTKESLNAVADAVRLARSSSPDASNHPLSRIARPKWLRSMVFSDPSIIQLEDLTFIPPLDVAESSFSEEPAAGYGKRSDGTSVVALFTLGVDMDLLPLAQDYRMSIDPSADLIICMPQRDIEYVPQNLLSQLENCVIQPIQVPWTS